MHNPLFSFLSIRPGMMAHACNLRTLNREGRGSYVEGILGYSVSTLKTELLDKVSMVSAMVEGMRAPEVQT